MTEKKSKMKVLIVEDDPFISDIYVVELESRGYKVELAVDGEDAMSKINKGHYALVVLDLLMPKKDGFQVLTEIKNNPNLKMPVIVLSNLGRKEHISKAMDMGAADYLIKTQFTPQEVVEKIDQVIQENK
ncbi:MAG: response regulator [Candidatus Moranbacteria bacterium]|nr:response regulator [Candidatus Moranbacteria bacterium]